MMMTRTKAAAPNQTTTANRPLSENPTKTNKAKAKLGSLQVDLERPRLIRMAPNGDIFIAESFAGCSRVLRPQFDPLFCGAPKRNGGLLLSKEVTLLDASLKHVGLCCRRGIVLELESAA
jgi:hypothetical protein